MNSQQARDTTLWKAFKCGDQSSFAEIYELHYAALNSYGRRFCSDLAQVEDAIQELFVTLWRSRERLSEVDNIKFYLFRCLRRDIYKQQMRDERVSEAGFEALLDLDDVLLDEQLFQEEELIFRIKAMLQNLPARQLEAISLRYYENFSYREIAEIMNISEKTVRNTLHNAMTQLRENLHHLNPLLQLIFLLLSL